MANEDSSKPASDRGHESYADDAKAQRILSVDFEGNVIETIQVDTKQENVQDLLENVIKELKIMNIHLSILTDNNIGKEDI